MKIIDLVGNPVCVIIMLIEQRMYFEKIKHKYEITVTIANTHLPNQKYLH